MRGCAILNSALILLSFAISTTLSSNAYAYYGSCNEPSKPSCIDFLGINNDEFSMSMCRSEIEQYSRSIKSYIECIADELEQESSKQTRKLNEVTKRYNCYARGEKFCL